MNTYKDQYILKYPTGEYVGLDDNSGGYPFKASTLKQVHFFQTLDSAIGYVGTMNREGFKIFKILNIELQEVEVQNGN